MTNITSKLPKWVKVIDNTYLQRIKSKPFYLHVTKYEQCTGGSRQCSRDIGCNKCDNIVYHGCHVVTSTRCVECTEEDLNLIGLYILEHPGVTKIIVDDLVQETASTNR